jgi:hypothetical protein
MQDPHHTLIEHKQNLCCMDTSKNNLIATGSWDQYVLFVVLSEADEKVGNYLERFQEGYQD